MVPPAVGGNGSGGGSGSGSAVAGGGGGGSRPPGAFGGIGGGGPPLEFIVSGSPFCPSNGDGRIDTLGAVGTFLRLLAVDRLNGVQCGEYW